MLDDTTLDIVMSTLDTITDFVEYLTKKEALLRSGRAVWAAGEEDLLAYYLSDIDENEQHAFVVPEELEELAIGEGYWQWFTQQPQRHAQLRANEISYAWDGLIESFAKHIIGGTQYHPSHQSIAHNEWTIRLLAREPRTRRRMLATSLLEVVGVKLPRGSKRSRHIPPSRPGEPCYVFMLIWHQRELSYEDFREFRKFLLAAYCMVLKNIYPEAENFVGIATEDRTALARSEDIFHLNAREWTDEDRAEALSLQEEYDILRGYTRSDYRFQEYPEIQTRIQDDQLGTSRNLKGRDRNRLCPCGSGKKVKKCCGSNTAKP